MSEMYRIVYKTIEAMIDAALDEGPGDVNIDTRKITAADIIKHTGVPEEKARAAIAWKARHVDPPQGGEP